MTEPKLPKPHDVIGYCIGSEGVIFLAVLGAFGLSGDAFIPIVVSVLFCSPLALIIIRKRISAVHQLKLSYFYVAPTLLTVFSLFFIGYAVSYGYWLLSIFKVSPVTAEFLVTTVSLMGITAFASCILLIPVMDILCWKCVKNRIVLWTVFIAFPAAAWIILLIYK